MYINRPLNLSLICTGNPPEASSGIVTATADAGFVGMIRTGMLALQLLPTNSAAGLVIVTGQFWGFNVLNWEIFSANK
jgi:hypothetical protein